MPSLSNARANSLDFTHVWISEPVVMEIFTKGPRTPHTTMTHEPVYPVMTFSEFLASKINKNTRTLGAGQDLTSMHNTFVVFNRNH